MKESNRKVEMYQCFQKKVLEKTIFTCFFVKFWFVTPRQNLVQTSTVQVNSPIYALTYLITHIYRHFSEPHKSFKTYNKNLED